MLTEIEKIRTWGKDDSVITCIRVPLHNSDAACELCNYWIAALPESRLKAKRPGWHLICENCFNRLFPELQKQGGDVKFGGRFRSSDEAKKVLPR